MQRQRLCFFPLGKKQTIDSTQRERHRQREETKKKLLRIAERFLKSLHFYEKAPPVPTRDAIRRSRNERNGGVRTRFLPLVLEGICSGVMFRAI